MDPCLKGNVCETWARVFSLLVLRVLPIHLQGLYVPYVILTCTLHVYKPAVWPVASRRLLFDIKFVTLLLREFNLFALANLYYPAIRLPHIVNNICSTLACIYMHDGMQEKLKVCWIPWLIIQLFSSHRHSGVLSP